MDRVLFSILVFVLCVSAQEPAEEEAKCDATHPLVGERFALSTLAHDVSGDVVIKSDCEFNIENFFYDGKGPVVYVYGFSEELDRLDDSDVEVMEYQMDVLPLGEAYSGETFPVMLPEGVTWDDVRVISIWCERFGVDFGSTVLEVGDE